MGGRGRGKTQITSEREAGTFRGRGGAISGTTKMSSSTMNEKSFDPKTLKRNMKAWGAEVEKKGAQGILAEFTSSIKDAEFSQLTTEAFDKAPDWKKRYRNVKCWDQSRVVLKQRASGESGDFVHASYVGSSGRERRWILAQAPLSATLPDFWDMIWQEEVGIILMLCQTKEKDRDGKEKDKSAQYWPLEEGGKMKLGKVEISTEKIWLEPPVEGQSFKTTALWIKNGLNRRRLYHLQYLSWGDQDVPASYQGMLRFQSMAKAKFWQMVQERKVAAASPMLVHCSAGAGRSGTYVALDNAVSNLSTKSGQAFSVKDVALAVRRHRFQAIQTDRQYLYIYQCLITHLIAKRFLPSSTAIPQAPAQQALSFVPFNPIEVER